MKTVKFVDLYEKKYKNDEEINFIVSSKNCIDCKNTNSDVLFAIDSIKNGNLEIKQIFMSNEETTELIEKLEIVLNKNNFIRNREGWNPTIEYVNWTCSCGNLNSGRSSVCLKCNNNQK